MQRAQLNLDNHLIKEYPVGIKVGVRLRRNQKHWTWGVVYSHWSGNVQVEFPYCKKRYRHVDPFDIMETRK